MKIQIETYGCAMNQADSEFIVGMLKGHGHEISADADIIVVNTCVVKSPTENKLMKRLRELDGAGKKVIVTGCLPSARPDVSAQFPRFSFIGTNVGEIATAVSSVSKGERFIGINEPGDKVCIPKIRKNPVVDIVPIAQGCQGSCNYCIARIARGELRSFPAAQILKQIEGAVKEGAKEVWITAQDTGAYGLDTNSGLPKLLRGIVKIPADFKARIGMMNPNHALKFTDELIEIYRNDKIYKFLHLPVQSGDDGVLADMGRQYTVSEFESIVERFREINTTISTDVIVGYPTETEEAFQNTIALIDRFRPDVLNISRFWSRPGTKASTLKQLPGRETKRRSRIMNDVFKRVGKEQNKKWLGWKGPALVSEGNDDGTFTARNYAYKPIVVAGNELLGKTVQVKVTECTYYDLRGSAL